MTLFKRSMNLFFLLIAALAVAFVLNLVTLSSARAADVVQTGDTFYPVDGNGYMMRGTFTVTSDGSGNVASFAFLDSAKLRGKHLTTIEAYSTTDAAFTVVLTTAGGSETFDDAWTGATSGEAPKNPDAYWPVYDTWSVDVTSLAVGEICTINAIFE